VRPTRVANTDAFGAIRSELVAAAARRRIAKRRRRRAIGLIACVATLAVTSAALAISNVSTGIPAIDRLLSQAGDSVPPTDSGRSTSVPNAPDLRPLAGSVSRPLEVVIADGARYTAIGFRSSDGMVCVALTPDVDSGRGRGVGCTAARLLRERLGAEPIHISSGASRWLIGFARGDVTGVAAVGSRGRTEAALSDAWNPRSSADAAIRFFVLAPGSSSQAPDPGEVAPTAAHLEVRFDDGRVAAIDP
jgi:hypothetical protein